MGMPVTLEIVDTAEPAPYERAFDLLREIDERFSTYKDTSEITKVNRGELSENEYSASLREVLARAEETKQRSGGYFDIRTPRGLLDPSGIVKGWAIQLAADDIHAQGLNDFYLEIAGDIQTSGRNAEGKEWSIGIRNPFTPDEIVKIVYPHGKGIATSGTYVRGAHIYNPIQPDTPIEDLVSLTVIGPNVYEADRFATAAFAMGDKGLAFIDQLDGFEAYGIDHTRTAHMTHGFEKYTQS